ncbi:MAG: SDR family oxidoreductase [Thermoprotei archaeon]|nr:SDR family oxidoreductase [TACK group archaeon]
MKNRKVLLVGVSWRLGAALAYALLKKGARVAIAARNVERLREIANSFSSIGQLEVVQGDASTDEGSKLIARRACEALEGIDDLAVTIGAFTPDSTKDLGALDEMVRTNLVSPLRMVSAVLPYLHYGSSVVLTTSISSFLREREQISYSVAKAALNKAVELMALELLDSGIRVNGVAPGVIGGTFSPNGVQAERKLGELEAPPEYYASVVLWLLSDGSRWVNGVVIPVDGGYRLKGGSARDLLGQPTHL